MSVQTSYSLKAPTARKGQFADNGADVGGRDVEACHASGTPAVGNLVLLAGPTAGDGAKATAAPLSALTVSATAILASTASSASAASITSASSPALATTHLNPARRITAVLSSHANWDATAMRIYGEDVMGNPIKESLLVPDAGGVTLTTHQFFSRVTKVELDAQSGTGGTFTMGYTADEGVYHPKSVGIAVRDTAREPLDSSDQFADKDKVDVLKEGRLFVAVEDTVSEKGAPAYLRVVTSGANVMGQWRSTPATGFIRQPWAAFETLSDADSIAVLNKVA